MLHLLLALVIVTASADSASLGCYSYGSGAECLHIGENIGYVGKGQMACAQTCNIRYPTYKAAATLYPNACLCLTDYPTCVPLSYPKCVDPPTSICPGLPTCILDAYNISAVITSGVGGNTPPPVILANETGGNTPPPVILANETGGNTPPPVILANETGGNTPPPVILANETGGNTPPPVILANETANMGCYHLDDCISIQSNIGYIGAGTGDKDYAQKCAQACRERVPNTQYAGLLYPSACLCMQAKPTCSPIANVCPIQDVQCYGSYSCQVGVYDTTKLLGSAPASEASVWKKYALTSSPIILLVVVLSVLALVAVAFAIYKCKSADRHMKLQEEEAEKQMGVVEELEKMQPEIEKQEKETTEVIKS